MNIREFDWYEPSLRGILLALSQGLEHNARQVDEGWDVFDALDYQDDLCGIAFVAAQTYITKVVADVNALRGARPSINKFELLKSANPTVADTKLTQMQLCDTMANHYKHRDEWPDWDAPVASRTTGLLRKAGFAQGNEHLCIKVTELLLRDVGFTSVVPLADMLSSWRAAVIESAVHGRQS